MSELTLEDLKRDIDNVFELTKTLESRLENMQTSLNDVDTKVSPLNTKVDGILKANVTINRTVNSIKSTAESHNEKYENLEHAIDGLKSTLDAAQNYIKDIENQQHKNIGNIDALNRDKEAIRKDLITHIGRVNEQFNKVKSACERVNTHEDELVEVKKLIKLGVLSSVACAGITIFIVMFQALGFWQMLVHYIQSFAK